MQPYFVFKNISSLDMGIIVNELPPLIKPVRGINKITIPGRDGCLIEDLGTHGSIIKTVECTISDTEKIDEIISWLDGSGDVLFSNQNDRKYQASIINQIPFNRVVREWYKFIIIFDCQPFGYALDNDLITLPASPDTVVNPATKDSRPVVKVYGTGTIALTINSKLITLTNVSSYVTIDSVLVDCYKDTALKNLDMAGEFPELIVGENTISWTGTVTKVEITPNWRYL